ncbi:hypothetical protein AYJ09_01505 [Candidatus Liberibacter solanacearum]|uniref:DUF2312 domain-containing protein n=1 Tax=Candidatus Liberibacter solanacearum TaxID=556287 RepID=UPI0009790033|nr:DUF2312 domain-containing protein [Candidatus Liberibacter solanacearum]ONI59085.1 hypothetical protein AYJ09_01505 [Candidatus Liberibacter solanacearum]
MTKLDDILPTGKETIEIIRNLVERIEKLEADRGKITEDIKYVYDEAKYTGFDVKALRRVVALRKKDWQQRMEEEHNVEIYLNALSGSSDKED